MRKIIPFAILAIVSLKFMAQNAEKKDSSFYVNVFINESNDIRIESDLVKFENISEKVNDMISKHELKIDENITYRIFADKSLKLGYIMDVEQKMFDVRKHNARRERYLLETAGTEIDGPNWLKKLEGIKIDKVKG